MKNIVFRISFILLVSGVSIDSIGQVKDWITGEIHTRKARKGDFKYAVGESNEDLLDAQMEAIKSLALGGDVTVDQYRVKEKTIENLARKSKRTDVTSIDFGTKVLELKFLKSRISGGKYYALYAKKVNQEADIKDAGLLESKHFWTKSIFPGMGQFYNKEPGKGWAFSVGEVVLIGTMFYSFGQAGNKERDAKLALQSGNLAQYNTFSKAEDDWRTWGTVLGITAGVTWIINIIDAASSDKNVYATVQRKNGWGLMASTNGLGIKYSF